MYALFNANTKKKTISISVRKFNGIYFPLDITFKYAKPNCINGGTLYPNAG